MTRNGKMLISEFSNLTVGFTKIRSINWAKHNILYQECIDVTRMTQKKNVGKENFTETSQEIYKM